jgi:hypothetical protein
MPVSAAPEAGQVDDARESHALGFRIAIAAAVGLTLGELLGWNFPSYRHAFCSIVVRSRANKRQAGFRLCCLMVVACTLSAVVRPD